MTTAMRAPARCLLVLLLLGPATPGWAMTYVVVPDDALADQAEIVAWVTIVESGPRSVGGGLWTEHRARIRDLVKGRHALAELHIRVPGGRLPDGSGVQVWGAPRLRPGDQALVLLARNPGGSFRILHVAQGLFRPANAGTLRYLVRDLPEAGRLPPPALHADGDRAGLVRDGARFTAWLRDRAAGVERPPDYFVPGRPSGPSDFDARFRLLGRDVGFRRLEFDRGQEVKWHRHREPQPGLARTGKLVKGALRAWSEKRSGAPVSLRFAGVTTSSSGVTRSDGRNTLMFGDHNDEIRDDFSCPRGGVLSLGGVTAFAPGQVSWKGMSFVVITEADVVINDGAECLFEVYPSVASQVYVHELGHGLGLGHSCEPFKEFCTRYTADATMADFLHNPGRGERLGADDLVGLRYIYDPGSDAVFCDLPPGHRAFCQRCGPCGEGQGSCARDDQCAGDLVCVEGAGAEQGFGSDGGNVCLSAD